MWRVEESEQPFSNLYAAVIVAFLNTITWLSKRGFVKAVKAVVKQGFYGSKLRDDHRNIEDCISAVREEANISSQDDVVSAYKQER